MLTVLTIALLCSDTVATPPTIPLPQQLLAHANSARLRVKQPAVTLSPELMQAAQWYADYLAATNQRGHYAYGKPWDRVSTFGFPGTILFNERLGAWYFTGREWKREIVHDGGEVLGFGHPDAATAFEGWMDSPKHKGAILEPSFDSAGFGNNGTIWVGLFGRSKMPSAGSLPVAQAPAATHAQPAAAGAVSHNVAGGTETGVGSSYPKRAATLPATFLTCGPGGCGVAAPYQPVRRNSSPLRRLFGR